MKKKAPIRVSSQKLQDLRTSLRALPPKPKVAYCARDTVRALSSEILHATTLGYSLADIAEHYREHGVEISPGTLASYLREMKPAKAGKAPAERRKRMSSAETSGINAKPVDKAPAHDANLNAQDDDPLTMFLAELDD